MAAVHRLGVRSSTRLGRDPSPNADMGRGAVRPHAESSVPRSEHATSAAVGNARTRSSKNSRKNQWRERRSLMLHILKITLLSALGVGVAAVAFFAFVVNRIG